MLDAVNTRSKTANALLRNAEPSAVDASSITVAFTTAQLAKMFADKSEFLREALRDVLGLDVAVKADVAKSAVPVAADPEPVEPEEVASATDSSVEADIDANADANADADPLTMLQQNLGAQVVDDPS